MAPCVGHLGDTASTSQCAPSPFETRADELPSRKPGLWEVRQIIGNAKSSRKWQQREWLHGQLTAVAESVLGVDIDDAAVNETRKITGLPNIIAGDITSTKAIDAIAERYFDIALFGEVVEHIGDPVRFLKQFLSTYERNVRDVIITVPNAFRAGNIKSIFANREVINSDHRFFFTPYTICKVACDAGIAPSSIQMASFSRQGPMKKLITSRWPLLAENIVLMGKPAHRSN